MQSQDDKNPEYRREDDVLEAFRHAFTDGETER